MHVARIIVVIIGLSLLGQICLASAEDSSEVDYATTVRPILADRCFACHGPDAHTRKAGLRLDVRDAAVAVLPSGNRAIIDGDLKNSTLVQRIMTENSDKRMPPANSHKILSGTEINLLKQWVQQGAPYAEHWAFVPPQGHAPPDVKDNKWSLNWIDHFVLAKLEAHDMSPSRQAGRRTLIRRLSFDLIGLPPTLTEVESFVNDQSPQAYEKVVDRLLASPHYGERMAVKWLDLVRYADTNGYHADLTWSMWPYRDYVINAFNANMPFDQFTREQIAGDLLPESTLNQKVAAAYNRLNMKSTEFGIQNKEYLARYAADRVRTTGTTWLDMTMGCAECHDHKFDPVSMRDFYSFAAFFADIKQKGYYPNAQGEGWGEKLFMPSPEHDLKIATLRKQVDQLKQERDDFISQQAQEVAAESLRLIPDARHAAHTWRYTIDEPAGDWTSLGFDDEKWQTGSAGFGTAGTPNTTSRTTWNTKRIWLRTRIDLEMVPDRLFLQIHHDEDAHVFINGKQVATFGGYTTAYKQIKLDKEKISALNKGDNVIAVHCKQTSGGQFIDIGLSNFAIDGATPTPFDQKIKSIEQQIATLEKNRPHVLATVAVKPRITRILPRGNWMDDSGEIVQPNVPEYLGQIEVTGRATRLDLANWLISRDNPLTARTMVNRLWAMYFGEGLYKSIGDIGAQGDPPSHPQLLDNLAVEFMESGWDIKHIVKLIVMSQVYRQSSAGVHLRDPYNRLLSRQGKWRLDAEFIRDNTLMLSGLLVPTIGGPSVKPYQPDGYWAHLFFPRRTYVADTGAAQYRRGLYTHWQRQFLHPALLTFDAPSREECTAKRPRSNTPLQALIMLNDPTQIEAARVLAARAVAFNDYDDQQRLQWVAERILARPLIDREVDLLLDLLARERVRYEGRTQDAVALTGVGLASKPAAEDTREIAAWASIVRVFLNSHEAITRN